MPTSPDAAPTATSGSRPTDGAPSASHPPRRQKVPPFARYEGTSAYKKNRRRAREYAAYKAARSGAV